MLASRVRGFCLCLGLSLGLPALAGTIEVTVRDEHGAAFAGVGVRLRLPDAPNRWSWLQAGESDPGGKVVFTGLAAGQYVVETYGGRDHVAPRDNPFASRPAATLESEDDTVAVELELWRGGLLVCRVEVHGAEIRSATVRVREIDYGHETMLRLPDGDERERRLVPGHWELSLDPIPGFLLTDVEIDGRSIAGHRPLVELESLTRPTFITWHLTARAELGGRVTFKGPRVGVAVVAELVEPGPWYPAVQARGGSRFERVRAGIDNRGRYEMVLPDGRWRVRAVGDQVLESQPEIADLSLTEGELGRLDFDVTTEEGAGSSYLMVSVFDPDGKRLDNATVEVWPFEPADRGEEPVASKRAARGSVLVRGLDAGDYVVAAAREGYVEGNTPLRPFDPEDEDSRRVRVTLSHGAVVHSPGTKFRCSMAHFSP